jgi:hypothetical protein
MTSLKKEQSFCQKSGLSQLKTAMSKLHLRAEGKGKPMIFVLTAGQRHEATKLEALIEQSAIKRVGRSRFRLWPKRLLGDKAYSSRKIRGYLKRRGIM